MRLFNCKVRLANSLLNEVFKKDVTAPEIVLLRVIHSPLDGEDALSEIKSTGKTAYGDDGETPRTDKEERERLSHLYGPALATIESVKHLNGVFPPGVPLPKTVDGVPGEIAPEEQIVRTRVAKAA